MHAIPFEPNVPGIYDMPAADYHAAPGVSNSMLGHLNPPARLPAYLSAPRKETPAMLRGTMIHQRILEPDRPLPRLAIQPEDMSLATKEGKAWKAEQLAAGREILGPKEGAALVGCVEAIRSDPYCQSIFKAGKAELSVFCELEGAFTKRRLDWLPDGSNSLVDIKTVRGGYGGLREFTKLMIDRRYHVQAAFYLDGWNKVMGATDPRTCFCFVVVEDEAPFLVSRYVVSDMLMEVGREQYRRDLITYEECRVSGRWPGHPAGIEIIEAPNWMRR